MQHIRIALYAIALSAIAACSNSPDARVKSAVQLAAQKNWRHETLHTNNFDLELFVPETIRPHTIATIYIEGDGLAWINSSLPSIDPTPKNPVGLKLALAQDDGAAYIGRPCQYVRETSRRACDDNRWWTSHRFAPETITAVNTAIDTIQRHYGAQQVTLVGYSGGGTIAALAAARRSDVAKLVTVAGNLDTAAWVKLKGITPLSGSLNPADEWQKLAGLPQIHFSGEEDDVVPTAVARSYAARFPAGMQPAIRVIGKYDHHCCWAEGWATLMQDAGIP